MKNRLLICLSLLAIWSCSDNNADNSHVSEASATKDMAIAQPDTSEMSVHARFPFGCADLTKLTYPKYWEGDSKNDGQLKSPGGKGFDDITQCFAAIHRVKPIPSPDYERLEVMKIGDHFEGANNLDTVLLHSTDSCRYRLPDIGIYECYYSYARYGNLLLLDPNTKNGKLLPIYADDVGGESHTMLRYFFIDHNAITIYEGWCYDDGCSLDEKWKITIRQDGEIHINLIRK
ncbi:MAG: hypothetical protein ACK500_07065 [Flavobacteriales bacterium]